MELCSILKRVNVSLHPIKPAEGGGHFRQI